MTTPCAWVEPGQSHPPASAFRAGEEVCSSCAADYDAWEAEQDLLQGAEAAIELGGEPTFADTMSGGVVRLSG